MSSAKSCVLFIIILLSFSTQILRTEQVITGDLETSNRIVAKLCTPGNHNCDIVKNFFCCYEKTPGTQCFYHCQKKVYGFLFNTECNIDNVCSPPSKFITYVECLRTEFKKAGIDLIAANEKLNICQASVLGLE